LNDLYQTWEKEISDFKYIPVISDALAEDGWQGRTGFVHQAVMADHPDCKTFKSMPVVPQLWSMQL
jgi:CDP-4-dehydro-6-deoxyglucose reductase